MRSPKLNMKKKTAVFVGATVMIVAGAGAAFAYWSTTGGGEGEASTTDSNVELSFSQTAPETNLELFPGQDPQEITGTVTNDSPDQNGYVGTVTATIESVDPVDPLGDCDADDYEIAGTPTPVDTDLAPDGFAAFGGQTIQFVNKATNQDDCQGATVNLTFTSD